MKLDLVIKRTPVDVGDGKVIMLDLEDLAVIERAESAYRTLGTIMSGIEAPAEDASESDKMAFAGNAIREANKYAKESIDDIFDAPIAEALWGRSSCLAFGDTPNNSRFGRAVTALLELYKPGLDAMSKRVEEQADAYAKEVLDEGDGPT